MDSVKRLAWSVLALACVAIAAEPSKRPNGLYAIFNTEKGTIVARLYEKETPKTVANFVALAEGTKPTIDLKANKMIARRLYDNITFHRVVRGEMIQAGDPTGTGRHPCGVKLQDEFLPGLRFESSGRLAMANTGEPDSGGCQFFITVGPMQTWNGKYTIFGHVVEGKEVAVEINHAPLKGDKPVDPVKLLSVVIERVGPEPGANRKH